MDREEQIEEMAEKMQKCYEKNGLLNFKWFAEALFNADYRKLPDNVILLDNDCFTVIAVNKSIQEIKNEAVKEFASKLKDKAVDFLYSATVDGHPGFDIHISELCHMIDELLKEYEK